MALSVACKEMGRFADLAGVFGRLYARDPTNEENASQ